MIASSPVEVTVTRGGKSILFLDVSRGVSYKLAAQEHRARREGMKLMECEMGHLITQAQDDVRLGCSTKVPFTDGRGRYQCLLLLRDWRRVT